jgi:hypothetical protein
MLSIDEQLMRIIGRLEDWQNSERNYTRIANSVGHSDINHAKSELIRIAVKLQNHQWSRSTTGD